MQAETVLDHITVTAHSLDAGVRHVEQALGVALQPGGEHPRMGTHNRLLRLGPAMFLEVIAPNPSAPKPQRPRWFALDTLTPASAPALTNWVARTTELDRRLAQASEDLGPAETLTRGALRWRLTVPMDGSLPLDGAAPALIEWDSDDHPGNRLPDQGVSLLAFELMHPQAERVERVLQSVGFAGPVRVLHAARPGLRARLQTPSGERLL